MASQMNDHSAMRPASLRVANAALVKGYLADGRATSRSELASKTSLSSQALGSILSDLVDAGLVIEQVRETTTPGRPPTEYRLNPRGSFTATVFARRRDYFVLIDDALNARVANVQIRFKRCSGAASHIDSIAQSITQTIDECGLEATRLGHIEFAVLGQIAEDHRVVLQTVLWPESNVDVAAALESAVGHPVNVRVVTVEQAQATHALASVDCDSGELIAILHFGVEFRIMLAQGGQLVANRLGNGGILTHLPVIGNDRACECGHRGCLGTVAGLAAMISHYQEISGQTVATGNEVLDLVREGDSGAIEAARRSGDWLAAGAAPILEMIMPDRIICAGGGVGRPQSSGAKRLVQALRDHLEKRLVDRPIHVVAPTILDHAKTACASR